jgi:hypothetical protein
MVFESSRVNSLGGHNWSGRLALGINNEIVASNSLAKLSFLMKDSASNLGIYKKMGKLTET